MERVCVLGCFSHVLSLQLLCTIAHQAPLSIGFSRLEQWSGLPCPSPVILPSQGSNLHLLCLPALTGGGSLPLAPPRKPTESNSILLNNPWITEEIKEKKYLETNENENNDSKSMKYTKSSTKREVYICKSLTQETRKI